VIALCVALVALAATGMGGFMWATVRLVSKTEGKATSDVDVAKKDETIARLEGELSVAVRDGEEAWRQAEQLAEGLQHALQKSPSVGTGVAADDVAGRLRAFRRLGEARDSADPVPAGPATPLPTE
jgi:hypothetical protein